MVCRAVVIFRTMVGKWLFLGSSMFALLLPRIWQKIIQLKHKRMVPLNRIIAETQDFLSNLSAVILEI